MNTTQPPLEGAIKTTRAVETIEKLKKELLKAIVTFVNATRRDQNALFKAIDTFEEALTSTSWEKDLRWAIDNTNTDHVIALVRAYKNVWEQPRGIFVNEKQLPISPVKGEEEGKNRLL